MLSGSDQYLAQISTAEEPVDSPISYSPFAEIESRSDDQEEAEESLPYPMEPAISYEDIRDESIVTKVQL